MPQEFLIDRRNILMQYNGHNSIVTIPEDVFGVDTNAFSESGVKKVIFPESLLCCSGGNGLISSTIEEITITNAQYTGMFIYRSLPALKRVNVLDSNDVRMGEIAVLAANLLNLPETVELYIPNLVLYAVDTTSFMDVKLYNAYLRNKHLYTEETGANYEEYMHVHKARFLAFLIDNGDIDLIKKHIREFDPQIVATLYEKLSEFGDLELNAIVSSIICKTDTVVKSSALNFSFLTNFFDNETSAVNSNNSQMTAIERARRDFTDFEVCYAEGNNVILGAYIGDATEITIPATYKEYKIEAVGVPSARRIPSHVATVIIEEGVIALQPMSMPCYNNVTSVTLPASLKYISSYAFATNVLAYARFRCKSGTYAWRWAKGHCRNVVEI